MKLSMRAKVANYLLAHEDALVTSHELASAIEVTPNQISQAMYILCRDSDDIVKYDRGTWIYRPSKPVVPVVPMTHRLYDLLSEGHYTRIEIAKHLGIKANEVSALIGRMNNDLQCRAESETYYSLVEK